MSQQAEKRAKSLALQAFSASAGPVAALLLALAAAPAAAQTDSPGGPVPPELLEARRAALRHRIGTGVAVLQAAAERGSGSYPQDSGYREDNDFFYLTGIERENAWLVLAPGHVTLYLPGASAQDHWTGSQLVPGAEAVRITGIEDVRPLDRLKADLQALVAGERPLLTKARLRIDTLVPGAPAAGDLRAHLAALRHVKDADEIRRLRRAIDITAEAHREAASALQPEMWEYELEALIEYTFRRRGAERVGFPSIVGSGPNGTVLHYDKNRRQMKSGDLVVVDVGAEFGYYTADVTRTYPVSGRFTARQRQLYDLVLGAQEAALRAIRPGVTLRDLDAVARAYMREHSAGLCGPDPCDRFFVHSLSHWLGMDVHDVGGRQATLQPGAVLTVEPGIYLPGEDLGIRIEDDVLVTSNGYELLSAGAPRKAAEIEEWMAQARQRRRAGFR